MRLLQTNNEETCNPSVKRKASCKHLAVPTQEFPFLPGKAVHIFGFAKLSKSIQSNKIMIKCYTLL